MKHDFQATWLKPLRKKANLNLIAFADELQKEDGFVYSDRKVGGWERIDNNPEYRDKSKVPFATIATVLTNRLRRAITADTLQHAYARDLDGRQQAERKASMVISPVDIAKAILDCPQTLHQKLLRAWNAETADQAADSIVNSIVAGNANLLFRPFTVPFEQALKASPATSGAVKIWGLVQLVGLACFAPGLYDPKVSQTIKINKAWIIRFRNMLAEGSALNGVYAMQDSKRYFIDDSKTTAFMTDGKNYQTPIIGVWQFLSNFIKEYDPDREKKPPIPVNDQDPDFRAYCDELDAELSSSAWNGENMFFCLSLQSTSSDEREFFNEYLPHMMRFEEDGTDYLGVEDFLLDNFIIYEQWVARWFVETGHMKVPGSTKSTPNNGKDQNMSGTTNNYNHTQNFNGNNNQLAYNSGSGNSQIHQITDNSTKLLSALDGLLEELGDQKTDEIMAAVSKVKKSVEHDIPLSSMLRQQFETATKAVALGAGATALVENIIALFG